MKIIIIFSESTRAAVHGYEIYVLRMLADPAVAPWLLTRRSIWRSRRTTAEEESGPRPKEREERPTTRRCPTRPTRIQPFRSRQGSVSRARILCARGVAWRRGCVAWRVWRRRGGSGALGGRGGGAKRAKAGTCARAGSGRIKHKRTSEDAWRSARAGGASVRLPWLLYFSLRV